MSFALFLRNASSTLKVNVPAFSDIVRLVPPDPNAKVSLEAKVLPPAVTVLTATFVLSNTLSQPAEPLPVSAT